MIDRSYTKTVEETLEVMLHVFLPDDDREENTFELRNWVLLVSEGQAVASFTEEEIKEHFRE